MTIETELTYGFTMRVTTSTTPPLLLVVLLVGSGCGLLDRLKGSNEDAGASASADAAGVSPVQAHAGCALPANGAVRADVTLKSGCRVPITTNVRVTDNATLTIEPGVTLIVEADRYVTVDKGKLVAKGTEEKPIVFTSASTTKAPGDWIGIEIADEVSAGTELDHVRIEHAGGSKHGGKGAIWFATQRSGRRVSLTNSVIENSAQAAVWSESDKGTFARFENNQLRKNKWSLEVPAEVLGSVGAGNTFTDPIVTGGNVDESVTWPAVDVPIFVERHLVVAGVESPPTLTIPPKTVVKFSGGKYLAVGERNGGSLTAVGVTFTSANPEPQPGDWPGIILARRATNVRLSSATVEYAGKGSGARAGVTVRAKAKELGGLEANGMTFRKNVGAAVSSEDGDCSPFTGATADGPLCKKR